MKEFDTGMHYPIKLNALPESWAFAYLGDVCSSIQSGFACGQHGSDDGIAHLRPMNISRAGILDLSDLRKVPAEFNSKRLDYGDVLFNNTNSPELIGKTAHVGSNFTGLAFSNHMTQAKLYEGISSRFAAAQLHYLWSARYFLHRCVKHVNQASISTRDLATSVPFVIPPSSEQQRIVAKLEELFSELDKGVENLRTAQQQLKVYRQALLKHAFEGKLTAGWRAQSPDKLESAEALLARIRQEREARYQQQLREWQEAQQAWEASGKTGSKPAKPKALKDMQPLTADEIAELPEIPTGWIWTRLVDSCERVVDCHNKTAPYQDTGIPLVRTPSIRNMKLNFDDSIKYVSQETYSFWSRRCPPMPGDILFTREAPMGEAAIIPDGKLICMGQRIMLVRPSKIVAIAKYLLFAMHTPAFKGYSEKIAVGTGVKHLRVGDVERLMFPICSISEQLKIAEILDSQFSRLEQLEQTIITSLQQAEALRQSILKKAFSGQLVPQHPDDEPASVLLARIRAERAAQQPTARRGRQRRAEA